MRRSSEREYGRHHAGGGGSHGSAGSQWGESTWDHKKYRDGSAPHDSQRNRRGSEMAGASWDARGKDSQYTRESWSSSKEPWASSTWGSAHHKKSPCEGHHGRRSTAEREEAQWKPHGRAAAPSGRTIGTGDVRYGTASDDRPPLPRNRPSYSTVSDNRAPLARSRCSTASDERPALSRIRHSPQLPPGDAASSTSAPGSHPADAAAGGRPGLPLSAPPSAPGSAALRDDGAEAPERPDTAGSQSGSVDQVANVLEALQPDQARDATSRPQPPDHAAKEKADARRTGEAAAPSEEAPTPTEVFHEVQDDILEVVWGESSPAKESTPV